jgi:TldD protein
MKKRLPSPFLLASRERLPAIIGRVAARCSFDYLSALGTDDSGINFAASPGETRVGEPFWVQRGFVFRAQREGRIVEYACNELPSGDDETEALLCLRLESLLAEAPVPGGREDPAPPSTYPLLPDIPARAEYAGEAEEDPFDADPEIILARLETLRKNLASRPDVAMAQARLESVDVKRLFLSPNRSLMQSFIWSQAYLFGLARRDALSKRLYKAVSGRKGLEILADLERETDGLAADLVALLDAVPIEPGEYDVILSPDMAGTLAHEAFGHGVETDMFHKGRAKAAEFIGKRVGSRLVRMYDGASGVDQTGSFLFDDEGNFGGKTLVIDDGILASGLSDALSAAALGIPATGNGRRQAFDHKAYARMTNTYFMPGSDRLDAMVAAIGKGWYLDHLTAGMEDPKNWGVQLVCLVGREIRDGAFTGRVASPVVCSGYVPDVLAAIDMVSDDFALSGSGACGKGYKEMVKVSSGGPCVKTRMRLG